MYLLDTNALIYYLFDVAKLSSSASEAISSNDTFVSIVSLWEIAIKQTIGKLNIRESIADIAAACDEVGFERLSITPTHLDCIKSLPLLHRDPFDRLLISQALTENLIFITSDTTIPKYSIDTLW